MVINNKARSPACYETDLPGNRKGKRMQPGIRFAADPVKTPYLFLPVPSTPGRAGCHNNGRNKERQLKNRLRE
jgi:hypothetical protein